MKLQLCTFSRTKDSEPEAGVAKLKCFGVSDVDWIMDDIGDILADKDVYDYKLQSELAYAAIDTDAANIVK